MNDVLLERPVWSTLTTVHASLSLGTARARRFDSSVSPFGAAMDESDESLAELGALVAATGPLFIGQRYEIVCPPGTQVASLRTAIQMHHDMSDLPAVSKPQVRRLNEADTEAMAELVELTNPGPFAKGTQCLGEFWGIERDGRLLAMAGERFRQPGFAEISSVCTHPEVQGLGFGRALCILMLERIKARGERAYLHVFDDNFGAIALYEKIGFRKRREMNAGLMEPV